MAGKFNLTGTLNNLKRGWKTPSEGRYLPYKEIGAYALGSLGYSSLINVVYIFMTAAMIPYMYGINNIHGTNIGLAVTVLNLFVQPIFAKLFDNSKSKMGKFRLFFALITPILGAFALAASWAPQSDSETFRIVYAYLTCVPTMLLSGIWAMLFTNMPLVMTPNNQERADMLAPVNLVVGFAPTVLNAIVPLIRGHYKQLGKEYISYRIIACIFVAVGILMSFIIVKFVKERVYVTETDKEKINFVDGIKQVLKNKPFMTFQVIMIFNTLKIYLSTQFYFIAMYKYSATWGEGEQIFGALSLITGFGATPGMLLAPLIIRKMKKKNLMAIAQLLFTAPMIVIMLLGGYEKLPIGGITVIVMTAISFLMNLNTGINTITSPTITGEQYDYQQFLTGKRLEGFMAAVGAWTAGIFGALLNYIPALLQKSIGFEQGKAQFQSSSAYLPENMAIIDKWFNTATLITIAFSLIFTVGLLFFYKLDEKKHAEIMEVLKSRALNADNIEETIVDIEAEENVENKTVLNGEEINKK